MADTATAAATDSEASLVALARQGSEAAIRRLIKANNQRLFRVAGAQHRVAQLLILAQRRRLSVGLAAQHSSVSAHSLDR